MTEIKRWNDPTGIIYPEGATAYQAQSLAIFKHPDHKDSRDIYEAVLFPYSQPTEEGLVEKGIIEIHRVRSKQRTIVGSFHGYFDSDNVFNEIRANFERKDSSLFGAAIEQILVNFLMPQQDKSGIRAWRISSEETKIPAWEANYIFDRDRFGNRGYLLRSKRVQVLRATPHRRKAGVDSFTVIALGRMRDIVVEPPIYLSNDDMDRTHERIWYPSADAGRITSLGRRVVN